MRTLNVMTILLVSLSLLNCATFPEVARKRATFDLGCDAREIQIAEIGNDTYGASGCGKKASYVCLYKGSFNPVCTMDSAGQAK